VPGDTCINDRLQRHLLASGVIFSSPDAAATGLWGWVEPFETERVGSAFEGRHRIVCTVHGWLGETAEQRAAGIIADRHRYADDCFKVDVTYVPSLREALLAVDGPATLSKGRCV